MEVDILSDISICVHSSWELINLSLCTAFKSPYLPLLEKKTTKLNKIFTKFNLDSLSWIIEVKEVMVLIPAFTHPLRNGYKSPNYKIIRLYRQQHIIIM